MLMLHENTHPTLNCNLEVSVPEKIVKLNVPHGDIFHHYNNNEWEDFVAFAKAKLDINVLAEYERYYQSWPQRASRLLRSILTRKAS